MKELPTGPFPYCDFCDLKINEIRINRTTFIKGSLIQINTFRIHLYKFQKETGKKFITRRLNKEGFAGVRIWRIE